MINKNWLFVITLGSVFSTIISCKNDIDIYAEYKETAVIYGMIDPNSSTQLIKINKAYQVKGNALGTAKIKDSSIYKSTEIEVYFQKFEKNNLLKTYPFTIDNSIIKEDGVFYTDGNPIYSFDTKKELATDINYDYKIFFKHKRNDGSVYEASSKCKLFSCSSNDFIYPSQRFNYPGHEIPGHKLMEDNSDKYNSSLAVKFTSVEFGKRYTCHLRLFYREETNGNTLKKFIDYPIGIKIMNYTTSGQAVEFLFNAEAFYNYVGQKISKVTPEDKIRRRADSLQYRVTVIDDNINTFITANNLASGISQEKPVFTNITNGLGFFGCRSTGILVIKPDATKITIFSNSVPYTQNSKITINTAGMNQASNDELAKGKFCKQLNFAYYEWRGTDQNLGGLKEFFPIY